MWPDCQIAGNPLISKIEYFVNKNKKMSIQTKTCSNCHQDKPLTSFKANAKCTKDGREGVCKECINAKQALKRAAEREKKAANQNEVDANKSKPCVICHETKLLIEFEICNSNADKRTVACKDCRNVIYEKSCSRCGVVKSSTEFDKNGTKLRSECKACRNNHPVIVAEKQCNKCHTVKPANEFSPDGASTDGLRGECKACRRVETITEKLVDTKLDDKKEEKRKVCKECGIEKSEDAFAYANKEKGTRAGKCKDCKNLQSKERYHNVKKHDPDYKAMRKEYREENKDKLHKLNSAWVAKNRPRLNEKERNRRREDIAFRVEKDLRTYMRRFFNKENHTFDYVGCTKEQLIDWFDFQTEHDEIDLTSDYHIDHVVPCSSFDLTDETHRLICFNWSNLRLCSAQENLTKNNKIDTELINLQVMKVEIYINENNLHIDEAYLIKPR